MRSLLNAIDGAHYVFRDEDMGLLYVWHGGAITNIYSEHSGECVDCFTLANESTRDNPSGHPDRREVHNSIVDHLAELQLPED